MDLTPEQDAAVRKWAAEGESVGEIRRRIKDEFGIPCTFLETRLYLIDHTVDMVDKSAPAEKEKPAEEPAPAEAEDAPAAGGVSVSADTVVPPGALAADADFAPQDGNDAGDIVITAPAKGTSGFFSVGRAPLK